MKVLVCGSRTWSDRTMIRLRLAALASDHGPCVIMHGGARGADRIAGEVAGDFGHEVVVYPADWKAEPRRAGFIRNIQMLEEAPDLVIAFWRGSSTGTAHTIGEAFKRRIKTEVHRWPHRTWPS